MLAMFFGAEGPGGRSAAAPYIEINVNFLLYFIVLIALVYLAEKFLYNPDAERSLYEHR